jgi:hypothetical protein
MKPYLITLLRRAVFTGVKLCGRGVFEGLTASRSRMKTSTARCGRSWRCWFRNLVLTPLSPKGSERNLQAVRA